MSELTFEGKEFFDQTPVAYPFQFERPLPLHLRIRAQIQQAMYEASQKDEIESIEEADDFDEPDDPDMWHSPYEQDFDHVNADLKTFSAASKEEPAEGSSSDGATQEKTEDN